MVVDIDSKSVVFERDVETGFYSAAMSHDGKYLAAGSGDNIIRLWDLESNDPNCTELRGHVAGVWSLAFSPDGRTLASAGDDRRVKLWSTETDREILTLHTTSDRPLFQLSFLGDGRYLAGNYMVDSLGDSWNFKRTDGYRVWNAPSPGETEAITRARMKHSVP